MPTAEECGSQADQLLDAIRYTNCNLDTNSTATADEYSAANHYINSFKYTVANLHTDNNLYSVDYTITDHNTDSDGYLAANKYACSYSNATFFRYTYTSYGYSINSYGYPEYYSNSSTYSHMGRS